MTRPSRRSLIAGLALMLGLAACSGSPNPVLYTLAPVPATSASPKPTSGST